ncbi:MarR family winged helix-turn-helix transcriptional regulator [Herbiconiux daphne]|uniref:MarR family transcriptional regulator n=1 Tax=Herbiconiux daphne TaxID=2970914 RepID=A0ABT2GYH4_9MICO|nr:MarR family transcriptional regulator [Herbiconiux daphne]MCS5733007.1 MarR family transcriptional regulator [Herbiconiux daphne]
MPETAPALSLSSDLRNATLRLARRIRLEKADDELSESQTSVLAYLSRNGEQTPNALAAWEHVSPPSMNRTLNALESAGYIARTPSGDDRRKVIVSVTDAGHAVVAETRRRRDAWLDRRLAALTATERATLESAAGVIRKVLEQ